LAAKYHEGAGWRAIPSSAVALSVSHTANSVMAVAAPVANIHFSDERERGSGRAIMAMNGNVPPAPFSNMTVPAKTEMFATRIKAALPKRCRPSPFSKGQRPNPRARPSSNGSSPVSPAQLSKKAQVTMIMRPTIAIVLHTRMGLIRSGGRPTVPSSTIDRAHLPKRGRTRMGDEKLCSAGNKSKLTGVRLKKAAECRRVNRSCVNPIQG
jgi:hypothetical protein